MLVNLLTHDRTTTDICALLKTGFPRQSAAFVKVAGVRTNFTIPDVHSIALGGGSLVRTEQDQTRIGPDSVGSRLTREGVYFGGQTLTVSNPDNLASSGLTLHVDNRLDLVQPSYRETGPITTQGFWKERDQESCRRGD